MIRHYARLPPFFVPLLFYFPCSLPLPRRPPARVQEREVRRNRRSLISSTEPRPKRPPLLPSTPESAACSKRYADGATQLNPIDDPARVFGCSADGAGSEARGGGSWGGVGRDGRRREERFLRYEAGSCRDALVNAEG